MMEGVHVQTWGFGGAACMKFSFHSSNPYVELAFQDYEAPAASMKSTVDNILARCNSTSCSDLRVSQLNISHGHYNIFAANPGPGIAIMQHHYTLFPLGHSGQPGLPSRRLLSITWLSSYHWASLPVQAGFSTLSEAYFAL